MLKHVCDTGKKFMRKADAVRLFGSICLLKDRYQKNYVLGPTHEELFTMR